MQNYLLCNAKPSVWRLQRTFDKGTDHEIVVTDYYDYEVDVSLFEHAVLTPLYKALEDEN